MSRKNGSLWGVVIGACVCCGGGAYVMLGDEYKIDNRQKVRCDACRRDCTPAAPCRRLRSSLPKSEN